MKKIALILLSAAILLSLCACGEKAPEASPAASEAPAEESTIVIEAPHQTPRLPAGGPEGATVERRLIVRPSVFVREATSSDWSDGDRPF